jgi:hypothetical protein
MDTGVGIKDTDTGDWLETNFAGLTNALQMHRLHGPDVIRFSVEVRAFPGVNHPDARFVISADKVNFLKLRNLLQRHSGFIAGRGGQL